MRIGHVVRAALTILVLAGVGTTGCSNDEAEKAPVITTAPSAPSSKPKPAAPALAFENVVASGVDAADNTFILTGLVRNTGNATGTFGVKSRASDGGVAIMSEIAFVPEVASLVPGLASTFTCKTDPILTGDHTSVQWTYWGTINGTSQTTQYTASFTFAAPAPPPVTIDVVFENVSAGFDGTNFHLTGDVRNNNATVAAAVTVKWKAKDGSDSLGSGETGLGSVAALGTSPFDISLAAGTHTGVTWTYSADVDPASGASYSTPKANISFP